MGRFNFSNMQNKQDAPADNSFIPVEFRDAVVEVSTQPTVSAAIQPKAMAPEKETLTTGGFIDETGNWNDGSSIIPQKTSDEEWNSSIAGQIVNSNAYKKYFYNREEVLKEAQTMSKSLKIPENVILKDADSLAKTREIYNFQQKQMDKDAVFEAYPELGKIAAKSESDAAIALHNLQNVKRVHGIFEAATTGNAIDAITKERSDIGRKLIDGKKLTTADWNRVNELEQALRDQKEIPDLLEAPVEAIVGGTAQQLPMLLRHGIKAQPYGLATGMIGGVISGAATGGVGTGVGFAQGYKTGVKIGYGVEMFKEIAGGYALDYMRYQDKQGNRLFTDNEASTFAIAAALLEAGIELSNYDLVLKTLGGGSAVKRIRDIVSSAQDTASARARLLTMIKDKAVDTGKVAVSESMEEAVQQLATDTVQNVAAIYKPYGNLRVLKDYEITRNAVQAFWQALPASIGLGAGAAGMNSVQVVRDAAHAMVESKQQKEQQRIANEQNVLAQLYEERDNSELSQKSPETFDNLVQENVHGTKYENVYIDTEIANEDKETRIVLNQLAQAAGITEEEVAVINETGAKLSIPTSVFVRSIEDVEVRRKLQNLISFDEAEDCFIRNKRTAKAAIKEMERIAEENVKRQAQAITNIVGETFSDEYERSLAEFIIFQNPDMTPYEAYKKYKAEAKQELEAQLAPIMQQMRDGMGHGITEYWADRETGEEADVGDLIGKQETQEGGSFKHIRVSNNAPWLQKFVKQNGKSPSQKDMKKIAIDILKGYDEYSVYGLDMNNADMDDLAKTKATIEEIQNRLAALEGMDAKMKTVDQADIEALESLSPEAVQVYRDLKDKLSQGNKEVKAAARVGALVWAYRCDRFAQYMQNAGHKDYTALDYYKRLQLDASGNAGVGVGNSFNQAAMQKENKRYILNDKGSIDWGYVNNIFADDGTEIKKAPVRMQVGYQVGVDGPGAGYVHIHNRHIDFIKNKGYANIFDIATSVLDNADFICLNNSRDGRPRLEVFVDLSPKTSIMLIMDYTEEKNDAYYTIVSIMPRSKKQLIEKKEKALSFNGSVRPYTTHQQDSVFYTPTDKNAGTNGDSIADKDNAFGTVSLSDADEYVKKYTYDEEVAEQQNTSFEQRAYHGSPMAFNRFDVGFIGSAAGTNTHGWGLYFAKNKKAADGYKKALGKDAAASIYEVEVPENKELLDEDKPFSQQLKGIQKRVLEALNGLDDEQKQVFWDNVLLHKLERSKNTKAANAAYNESRRVYDAIDKLGSNTKLVFVLRGIENTLKNAGYSVEQIEAMKNSEELRQEEMAEYVPAVEDAKAALEAAEAEDARLHDDTIKQAIENPAAIMDSSITGQRIYYGLSNALSNGNKEVSGDRLASEYLNKHGIKGITYNNGPDGRCFVVFDDKAVSIIERYNQSAGTMAITANTQLLEKAKNMEATGAGREEIYKATGWHKGVDGMWRFEIPDNLDKIDFSKLLDSGNVTLGEIYDNPQLYKAYPFLADMLVLSADLPDNVRGRVSYYGRYATSASIQLNKKHFVDSDAKTTHKKLASTLIHEIQHLIQDYEGFASGGSQSKARKQIENTLAMYDDELRSISPEAKQYYAAYDRYNSLKLKAVFGEVTQEELKEAENVLRDSESKVSEAERKHIKRIKALRYQLQKQQDNKALDDIDAYLNLAGEQEARAATEKAELATRIVNEESEENAEELQKEYDDAVLNGVNEMTAIVVFNGGEVGSANAMYRNNAKDIVEFKKRILDKVAKNTYFEYDTGAGVITIPDFSLHHIHNEHHLKDEEWQDFLEHANNIVEAYHGRSHRNQNGMPMAVKIKTPNNLFGAVLEFNSNGRVFLKTLFKGTDNSIDETIKNRGAAVRFLPKDKSAISDSQPLFSDKDAAGRFKPKGKPAIPDSQPLSIDSIQEGLGIVNKWHIPTADDAVISFGGDTVASFNAEGVLNLVVKGQTDLLSNGERIVRLFATADQSTFLHESAHIFYEDMRELAQDAKAPEELKKDFAKLSDWCRWREDSIKDYEGSAVYKEFIELDKQIKSAKDKPEQAQLLARWEQERFARAFEEYLKQGSAPTKGLAKAFAQLKKWLVKIYRGFISVGAVPSRDVTDIMDRMLVSEEEADRYRKELDLEGFRREGGLKYLNDNVAQMWEQTYLEAVDAAKAKVMKIAMRDITDKNKQERVEKLNKERDQERERLSHDPVFIVWKALQNKDLAGIGIEELCKNVGITVEEYAKRIKVYGGSLDAAVEDHMWLYERELKEMDIEELRAEARKALDSSYYRKLLNSFEAEFLETAIRKEQRLSRKILRREQLTEQELKEADVLLVKLDKRKDKEHAYWKSVREEIVRYKKKLKEDYKEQASASVKAYREEADKRAMRNLDEKEDRGRRALRDAVKNHSADVKDYAEKALARLSIRDGAAVPGIWRKKAKERSQQCNYYISKFDWQKARDAKVMELIYNTMADIAQANQNKVKRKADALKRRQNTIQREKNLPAKERYLYNHLLYMVGLAKADVPKPQGFDFQEMIASYKGDMEMAFIDADGNITLSDWFIGTAFGDAAPQNVNNLKMAQFKELADFMDNLYTVGVNAKQFKTVTDFDGKKVTIEDAAMAIALGNKAGYNNDPDITKAGSETAIEKAVRWGKRSYLSLVKAETIFRTVGAECMHYCYDPIKQAADNELKETELLVQRLQTIRKDYRESVKQRFLRQIMSESPGIDTKQAEKQADKAADKYMDELTEKKYVLGTSKVSRENILVFALNWGTEKNRLRVVDGFSEDRQKIDAADIENLLKELNGADWTFVSDIWKLFDSYWPRLQDVESRMTGVTMEKEKALEFSILGKDNQIYILDGGYYPIKYDRDKNVQTLQQANDEAARMNMSGSARLGTKLGQTKARSNFNVKGRKIRVDLDVVAEVLSDNIHIITMREAVRDVNRIINHPVFKGMIENSFGKETYTMLQQWVLDCWAREQRSIEWLEVLAQHLRTKQTMAVLGFRTTTALLNILNIAPMADYLGVTRTLKAIKDYYTDKLTNGGKQYEMCMEKSVFLRNRAQTMDRDMRSVIEKQKYVMGGKLDNIQKSAFYFITQTDLMLACPLWISEYKRVYRELVEENAKKRAQLDKQGTENPDIIIKKEDVIEREAVNAGDAAVRRVFGSGQIQDLAAVQKGSEVTKMFTMYYSYFSVVLNALDYKFRETRNKKHTEAMAHIAMGFLFWIILPAVGDTLIKTLISGNDDDKEPEEILKRTGANILNSAAGGIPILRDVVPALTNYALTGKFYGTGGTVFDETMGQTMRILSAIKSDSKDGYDVARESLKLFDNMSGFPQTVTDGIISAMEFIHYGEFTAESIREYLWAIAFDKRPDKKK